MAPTALWTAKELTKSLEAEMSEHRRTYTIITAESDPGYTSARREITIIFSPDQPAVRLPPVFNIKNATPPGLGIAALMGVLQSVLLPDNVSGDSSTDWIFLATVDLQLPVLLCQRLDNDRDMDGYMAANT